MDMLDRDFLLRLMMILMIMIKIVLIIMITMAGPVYLSIGNIIEARVTVEVAHSLNIGNGGNRIGL